MEGDAGGGYRCEYIATGGRLKMVANYLEPHVPFGFTYGEGVADIDIKAEIAFHKKHGKYATVCAVLPPGLYGSLLKNGDAVAGFEEKPLGDGSWNNAGFFMLQPDVLN